MTHPEDSIPTRRYKVYPPDPNPSGICACGCEQRTRVVKRTHTSKGLFKGHHGRFVHGHWAKSETDPFRVEDRGYKTPCHIWQRSQSTEAGYGQTWVDGIKKMAHVAAWEAVNGPAPAGRNFDHLCRQHDCINADHVEPVTQAVNVQRGDLAKLTPDAVREIRRLAGTMTQREIAALFGVGRENIGCVIRRHTWANID